MKYHVYEGLSYVPVVEEYDASELGWLNYDVRPDKKLPVAKVLIDPLVVLEQLFQRDILDWDNDYVVKPIVFRRKPIPHDEEYIPYEFLFPRDILDWDNDYVVRPILPGFHYKVIFDHYYGPPTLVYPKCVASYMTEFPVPYGGRI